MGCGNCSSGTGGSPAGCKGNGGCSTGACNRFNVYNWLRDIPLHDGARPYTVVEMTFNKGSRKEFFRNNTGMILEKGDWMAVEGTSGFDVGQVSLTGELVKLQMKKYGVKENDVTKRILHHATEEELQTSATTKEREPETLIRSRAIARSLNLDMKLCEVELQADGKKGTFFYTADQRVDFRELIRVFATDFKLKVEMRQIGARQESGKVGGIGSCGRELCCSTWLTEFKSVNTSAARYQNLSINQTKLSGQCGRLKCCLNYELDTYMDALTVFPDNADSLDTVNGPAYLQKKDIFKNLMWYSFPGNNKQYPLSIERVQEIIKLNKEGKKADELQPVELEARDARGSIKADMGFVNDVGQITLKNLEKNKKKKKKGKPGGEQNAQGGGKGQQNQGGGNRPQQQKGQQKPSGNTGGGKPQQEGKQGNKQGRPQGEKSGNNQPRRERPDNSQPNAATGDNAGSPQQQRPPRPQQGNKQQGPKGNREGGANRPQNRGPRPPRDNNSQPEPAPPSA